MQCHQIVNKGYNVQGKFYCPEHLDSALPKCYTCGSAIRKSYVLIGHDQRAVCLACRDKPGRCFLCSLPADLSTGGAHLPDGRSACREHAQNGVVQTDHVQRLFRQATLEISDTFGDSLQLLNPVRDVRLVDLPGIIQASQNNGHHSGLESGKVLGVTTITFVSQGSKKWLDPSVIHFLSHVPADRMLAVAAHEYAHVWHAEHHRNYTQTQAVVREGFAEWVAYKVCQKKNRSGLLTIMKNPQGGVYYQGLVKFLELEKNRGVAGVLEYAKVATSI